MIARSLIAATISVILVLGLVDMAGECGSLFKLPALYPGTSAAGHQGPLPTHVHKRGCGPTAADSTTRANCRAGLNDHMTLGFWSDGSGVNDAGRFTAAGPERSVDKGCLYAGKDLDDVPNGRRLFWGWITCTTAGAETGKTCPFRAKERNPCRVRRAKERAGTGRQASAQQQKAWTRMRTRRASIVPNGLACVAVMHALTYTHCFVSLCAWLCV